MTEFTRLTVRGTRRRAEIVVAADEPYAALVPRFAELLDESADAGSLTLIRVTGEEIDLSADSRTLELPDGEVLLLTAQADAPPPPEVTDVTDTIAEGLARHGRLWDTTARRAVAAATVGVAALLGGFALAGNVSSSGVALGALAAVAAVAVAAAVLAGRLGATWTALAATALGAGLGVPLASTAAAVAERGEPLLPAGVAVGWIWIALGLGLGVGLRRRGAILGSILGVVLAAVAIGLTLFDVPVFGAWAVLAVLAIILLGVLPGWALAASGLTGLDDGLADGDTVSRTVVSRALAVSHRTLDWAVGALSLVAAGGAAVLLSTGEPWWVGLGAATILVAALRTRAFPGALQGVFLWTAVVLASVVGIAANLTEWWSAAGFAVLLLVAVGIAGLRPAAHHRARLRSLGNIVEAIAVICLLPLVLGGFGLYAALLETFA